MATLQLQVKTSAVPTGFCFQGFTTPSWTQLVSYLHVDFPVTSYNLVISSTIPDPEFQDNLWIKTNASGIFVRPYIYSNGDWLCPFDWSGRTSTDSYSRSIWVGTLNQLELKDRDPSDSTLGVTVTDRTGPFWEEDTAMRGYMPIGVGSIGGSGTAVAVNGTGGSENVTLTEAQILQHEHVFGQEAGGDDVWLLRKSGGEPITSQACMKVDGNTDAYMTGTLTSGTLVTAGMHQTDDTTVSSHSNMPPYFGVYFIKRTARLYYCET